MPRLLYTKLTPDLYAKLTEFSHAITVETALEPVLRGLVYLRASVLNGCGFCTGAHAEELRHLHEPETRIAAVGRVPTGGWADGDAFTPKEQAALAWTDAVTRLRGGPISDAAFAAVRSFFSEKEVAELTYAIANINAWNRLGVAFAMEWAPAGPKSEAKA